MLIGFAALGTEVSYAIYKQRQMRSVASAAAFSGATALMTGHPANFATEVKAIAAMSGYVNGTASATVTINNPPLAGNYVGVATAVEVIIGQPQTLPMSGLFITGPWTVTGRAVAVEGNSASDCVLSLNTASTTGVLINNGASVTMNQCGLGVNATGSNALTVNGATLTANSVSVSGTINSGNGGTITSTSTPKTLQAAVTNPYSAVAVPTYSGCAYTGLTEGSGTHTLSPGVYCGGLSMGNGGTVTLGAGIYIINGGTFNVAGGVTLSGTNVTIVLTGSGSNYATASVSNGSTVTLSAPTTGTTAGIVFFADPNGPTTGTSSFQGGSTLSLTGALYFPTQTVDYGNGTTAGSSCTQLVAWNIVFVGGASFKSSCATAGVQTIGGGPSKLVE
jgi:hypothetical protein